MGGKMKLSPPTTKTQKPQRYLTLLYRHLERTYGKENETIVTSHETIKCHRCSRLDWYLRYQISVYKSSWYEFYGNVRGL
jgi:hypothetical protein